MVREDYKDSHSNYYPALIQSTTEWRIDTARYHPNSDRKFLMHSSLRTYLGHTVTLRQSACGGAIETHHDSESPSVVNLENTSYNGNSG